MGENEKSAVALNHPEKGNRSYCLITGSGVYLHLHQDATVLQRSLADGMASFPSLDFRFLNRIHLNELVEMALVAPAATVVVELDGPSRRVDDGRVLPVGELDEKPRHRAAEKLCFAMHGFGESQPTTSRSDSGLIVNLRLNLHDVRHEIDESF